jgi:hypothetical protein
MGMQARARYATPTLTGLILIGAGFLVFVGSYFLLPLYVTTVNCFDVCEPSMSATMWELSLRLLANANFSPVGSVVILALLQIPLLAAVVGIGCSLAYRVRAHRMLAVWRKRAWVAGSAALFLMLPLLLVMVRPDWGYLGMLLGVGMCWAGTRILSAPPQAQLM